MKNLPASIVWRRVLDNRSFELLSLARAPYGYQFCGLALLSEADVPMRVAYRISCDEEWQTRACVVEQMWGNEPKRLLLEKTEQGWFVDGMRAPYLDGCSDVDLGISPSTNTLAINRLKLAKGERGEIRAAWVKFPALNVEAGPQSYERVAEQQYIYRSLGSDFKAVLDVDEEGLVVTYEAIWERFATAHCDTLAGFSSPGFADALISQSPSEELGAHSGEFDWLVGGWSATVFDFEDDGSVNESRGEWWFSWVLEGRAIQDVWIVPPRKDRTDPPKIGNRYGTTIRTFDVKKGEWRIVWCNPVSGVRNELAGKRICDRIVLEGTIDGERARWTFNDISPTRFVWRGETLSANGTWKLGAEFVLRRMV